MSSSGRAGGDRGRRASGQRPVSEAFLLAQIGAHGAARYAERVAALDLTPAQTGLLRLVAVDPGQSQQALARLLDTPPSRLVALVDGLEGRGLVERRRQEADRRLNALFLTPAGEALYSRLGEAARAHNDAMTAGLSPEQRRQLRDLLTTIAQEQGLTAGVHPGYRSEGGR